MAKKKKGDGSVIKEVDILKLNRGRMTCFIRGSSPLIYNAMSQKAKMELLYPRKKTAAEKAATPKHNPPEEYRGSVYKSVTGPTRLVIHAVSFKRAMASAALDLGGAKKTQVDRLVWAIGERIPVWGVPMLRMDIIKQAGMSKAPDVRTRACLTEWACKIELAYVMPALNDTIISNLLAAAGMIRGVGDFRQEKGAGNFGQFELVNQDDPDWHRIVEQGGRDAQEEALANPVCYDEETDALYTWWFEEAKRRGHLKPGASKVSKSNGQSVHA
jgi:hypothetical protein